MWQPSINKDFAISLQAPKSPVSTGADRPSASVQDHDKVRLCVLVLLVVGSIRSCVHTVYLSGLRGRGKAKPS